MERHLNRFLATFLVVALAANGYLAWQLHSRIAPQTAELDADIAAIRLARSQKTSNDTLIRASAFERDAILAQSEAMLEQRRSAFLRFINLQYSVDGQTVKPADMEALVALDSDITTQQETLNQDRRESGRYVGGLLQTLASARVAISETTLAALAQKRLMLKYGVVLPKTAPMPPVHAPDQSALSAIEADIEAQRKVITEGELEAAQYTGGLMQAMILSRVATDKFTLALLQQKRLALKHDIGALFYNRLQSLETSPKPTGTVVKDKDAL
jgi:hypothetical protein